MELIINLSWVKLFFNSPFFSGLATILTGVVAYIIFLRQKSDERLKAARIIMVEVADCERVFDTVKTSGFIDLSNTRYLPFENSWNKHKHLFAKLLDAHDLKLIDNFYSTCALINKELGEAYSLPDYWREKGRIVAELHAGYSEQSKDKQEYELLKSKIKLFEEDEYWWQPFGPPKKIIERIKNLQYISTTSTGDKMKGIAKL